MRKVKECKTEITESWTIFIMLDTPHTCTYMLAHYIKCYIIITCQYTKRKLSINNPLNKGIDQVSC